MRAVPKPSFTATESRERGEREKEIEKEGDMRRSERAVQNVINMLFIMLFNMLFLSCPVSTRIAELQMIIFPNNGTTNKTPIK